MNTCKNCGKKSKGKYCSYICRNIFINKNLRDYKKNGTAISKLYRKLYEKNPKICPNCNSIIPYDLRENKYCSKKCRKETLIVWNKNRKGEKRNFSKSGIENMKKLTYERLKITDNVIKYNQNPNYCKQCNLILSYNKRKNIFCNIVCKRKYDKRNMSEYQKYYRECQFDFALNEFPNEFEFSLIEKHGWYQAKNHGNNLKGVSRDHIYSIREAYENKINSEIISHPANCQLMIHSKNISKHRKSDITLDELNKKINNWNLKYNMTN